MSLTRNGARRWGWWVAVAAVVVGAVVLAGPGPSADSGPQGTLALRRLLAGMGLTVRTANRPPAGGGIFVLLADLRTGAQAHNLLGWVQDGGTLVVADPGSTTLGQAGLGPTARVGHYSFGPPKVAPGCITPETAGIRSIAVDPADFALEAAPGAVACFPISGGAFELAQPLGQGRLIALGGFSPFTNALLDNASNAAFAVELFGSAPGPVVFGPPFPPGAPPPPSLWHLLPLWAKALVFQVVLALVAFAAVSSRRFGAPAVERLPSPVPASELVEAVGRLYRSSRAVGFAGDTLRSFTVRRIQRRFGAGRGAPDVEALAAQVSGAAGMDLDTVRRLLGGPPPSDDAELIALGRDLEELGRRVEESVL
ncbi:MAG TPA: DUF4350 domain-containing protein [Actinomycetota bacterium]|nr:DUF4350 domain-containing protein [Actinomycetota bacterium]